MIWSNFTSVLWVWQLHSVALGPERKRWQLDELPGCTCLPLAWVPEGDCRGDCIAASQMNSTPPQSTGCMTSRYRSDIYKKECRKFYIVWGSDFSLGRRATGTKCKETKCTRLTLSAFCHLITAAPQWRTSPHPVWPGGGDAAGRCQETTWIQIR